MALAWIVAIVLVISSNVWTTGAQTTPSPLTNATATVQATFTTSSAVDDFVTAQSSAIVSIARINTTVLQFAFVGPAAAANLQAFSTLSSSQLLAQYGIIALEVTPIATNTVSTAPTTTGVSPPSNGARCVYSGSTSMMFKMLRNKGPSLWNAYRPVEDVVAALAAALGVTPSRINALSYLPYDDPYFDSSNVYQATPVVILTFTFVSPATPTIGQPTPQELVVRVMTQWSVIALQLSSFRPVSIDCLAPGFTIKNDEESVALSNYRSLKLRFFGAMIAVLVILIVVFGAGWWYTMKLELKYRAANGIGIQALVPSSSREGSPIVLPSTPSPEASPNSRAASMESRSQVLPPARSRRAVSFHAQAKEL
jgi:hypothetical protein